MESRPLQAPRRALFPPCGATARISRRQARGPGTAPGIVGKAGPGGRAGRSTAPASGGTAGGKRSRPSLCDYGSGKIVTARATKAIEPASELSVRGQWRKSPAISMPAAAWSRPGLLEPRAFAVVAVNSVSLFGTQAIKFAERRSGHRAEHQAQGAHKNNQSDPAEARDQGQHEGYQARQP